MYIELLGELIKKGITKKSLAKQIGITEKVKMTFNEDDSKFMAKQKTYNCPSCDEGLNESQIKHFNL